MPVGIVQVGVLDLHRRREQEIGEVGGVGLEVVDDHGEEILAGESLPDPALVRRARRRIAAVDEERLHRLIARGEERLREARHREHARAGRPEIVAPERGPVPLKKARVS